MKKVLFVGSMVAVVLICIGTAGLLYDGHLEKQAKEAQTVENRHKVELQRQASNYQAKINDTQEALVTSQAETKSVCDAFQETITNRRLLDTLPKVCQ